MTLAETVDLVWRLSSSQSRSVGLSNQDVQAMDVARYATQEGSLPRGRCLPSLLAGNKEVVPTQRCSGQEYGVNADCDISNTRLDSNCVPTEFTDSCNTHLKILSKRAKFQALSIFLYGALVIRSFCLWYH